jgi:hypothetical protein
MGDLQQVVDSLGQAQHFDFAVLLFGSGEGTNKFADTGAVDIVHLAKVQQDPFLPLGKEVVHGITQSYAAFTEGDSALEVDDRDAIGLTGAEIYAHGKAFPYHLPKKSPGANVGQWLCARNLSKVIARYIRKEEPNP